MGKLHQAILLGVTVASLSLTTNAMAEWGGAGHCGHMKDMDREQMEKTREHHQAALHDQLKLDEKQEAAWKKFVAQHGEMGKAGRPMPEELEKLTAPQRMEKMLERMRQHEARMAEHLAALKEFYAVLTPAQQKIFDEHLPVPGKGGMHPH